MSLPVHFELARQPRRKGARRYAICTDLRNRRANWQVCREGAEERP